MGLWGLTNIVSSAWERTDQISLCEHRVIRSLVKYQGSCLRVTRNRKPHAPLL